eukprot:GDKI01047509.1.p1 GENE.GDKI01047509.1~~GDKI01047509.1.p1  ORF type:complete len:157 (+),score=46.93 GDKI01047509.1:94-564(+)
MAMIATLTRSAFRSATTKPVFGRALASQLRPFASGTFYTKSHEWLRVEDQEAVLGVTDFAQNQLGEVVFVDLPDGGKRVKKGQTVCSVESVKAVGEVYAPVSCEVLSSNAKLSSEPKLVNDDPEGEGWMVRLKLAGPLDGLLDRQAYLQHCEQEKH